MELEPLQATPEDTNGTGTDAAAGNGALNLVDVMRARFSDAAAEHRLKLPVPSWDGDLIAEYVVIARSEMPQVDPATVDYNTAVGVNSDVLIRACRALYWRLEDGTLELIAERDAAGVSPYARIGAMLGLDEDLDVRGRLAHVFRENHVAIVAHGVKVFGWMQDTTAKVEGALGER